MPIYEYKCRSCDERFEIEQRISDDALTALEGCEVADDGAHALKKIFSSIGISFKGDGFYRNDARGSSRSAKSPDKPADKPSEKSSETTTTTSETPKSSNGSSGGSSDSGATKAATSSD